MNRYSGQCQEEEEEEGGGEVSCVSECVCALHSLYLSGGGRAPWLTDAGRSSTISFLIFRRPGGRVGAGVRVAVALLVVACSVRRPRPRPPADGAEGKVRATDVGSRAKRARQQEGGLAGRRLLAHVPRSAPPAVPALTECRREAIFHRGRARRWHLLGAGVVGFKTFVFGY